MQESTDIYAEVAVIDCGSFSTSVPRCLMGWVLPGITLVFGILTVSSAFVKVSSSEWGIARDRFTDGEADVCTSRSRKVSLEYLQSGTVRRLQLLHVEMVSEKASVMLRWGMVLSLMLRNDSGLAFRLSLYIVIAPFSRAASGLVASAILKLDHFGSAEGWAMIFAIEGLVTIGLALVALLATRDRPETGGRSQEDAFRLLTRESRYVG